MRFWDLAGAAPAGPRLTELGPSGGTSFSPDSRLVLTGGADGDVRIWDASNRLAFRATPSQLLE